MRVLSLNVNGAWRRSKTDQHRRTTEDFITSMAEFGQAVHTWNAPLPPQYKMNHRDLIILLQDTRGPSISTSRSLPLLSTAQKAPQALVERQSYCLIANRTKETLTSAIKQLVAPGSTFISDCWRGYNSENLAEMGIGHKTVSRSFVFYILIVCCYRSIIRKTS